MSVLVMRLASTVEMYGIQLLLIELNWTEVISPWDKPKLNTNQNPGTQLGFVQSGREV